MQHTISTRDDLVLEAHPKGDSPHIPLRREGEPGSVCVCLSEMRSLADAMRDTAAHTAGHEVGDDE